MVYLNHRCRFYRLDVTANVNRPYCFFILKQIKKVANTPTVLAGGPRFDYSQRNELTGFVIAGFPSFSAEGANLYCGSDKSGDWQIWAMTWLPWLT